MWSTCPHKWKLTYIDKKATSSQSIHTIFGTSMHETIQWWLHTMFNKSIKDSEKLNLEECLQEQMMQNYAVAVAENNNEHFSNPGELREFYEDGVAILDFLKKRRVEYFTNQGYELVGIEIPLYIQASDSNEKVFVNGFIDIVLRDIKNDRIIIIDIKTSTKGWNAYAKKDKIKASQLVLYKSYFAKQFGYDEEKIDIKYFIVKRKLIEGLMYPQKRIQIVIPPSGKPTRNKLLRDIENFIESGFNEDGTYKIDGTFPSISGGKAMPNCKYCEFASKEEFCPKSKRII
jgi:hypothetical protein